MSHSTPYLTSDPKIPHASYHKYPIGLKIPYIIILEFVTFFFTFLEGTLNALLQSKVLLESFYEWGWNLN